MAGKKSNLGHTGKAVSNNVARLREDQNLTYAELSRRLTDTGAPIPELGLRNIERGQRKVDVDELVALAAVLNSSPAYLLLPHVDEGDVEVSATGLEQKTAEHLWHWLRGEGTSEPGSISVAPATAGPHWLSSSEQQKMMEHAEFLRRLLDKSGLADGDN